jgi:pimeloyl-ACP methyl ester carboxylesterase
MQSLLPSIRRLDLDALALARLELPVLVVHGTRDRSAPYGGGREWALWLPQARLLTIPEAGHAPWIEAPETTLAGIDAFLDGRWPAGAEIVHSVEP